MRKKILPYQKKYVILQPISEIGRKHESAENQREIGPLAQLVRAADS